MKNSLDIEWNNQKQASTNVFIKTISIITCFNNTFLLLPTLLKTGTRLSPCLLCFVLCVCFWFYWVFWVCIALQTFCRLRLIGVFYPFQVVWTTLSGSLKHFFSKALFFSCLRFLLWALLTFFGVVFVFLLPKNFPTKQKQRHLFLSKFLLFFIGVSHSFLKKTSIDLC